jgi:hypothetical protein
MMMLQREKMISLINTWKIQIGVSYLILYESSELMIDVTPRAALPENIERFLDLSASEEDHGEVRLPSR